MKKPDFLASPIFLASVTAGLIFTGHAWAQSSLGIGANEVAMQPVGPFAHVIQWIMTEQRNFYLAMTGALKAMREDPWQAAILIGLSFVYGIFHAIGPGHGKAVISSYMIANETALKRGVFLSFVSSILQAFSAILVVGLAWLVLRGTSVSMKDTARYMELASYALVIVFGLWLLRRKVPLLFAARSQEANAAEPSGGFAVEALAFSSPGVWEGAVSEKSRGLTNGRGKRLNYNRALPAGAMPDHAYQGTGETCAACGNNHAPDPAQLSGDFNWKTAWSAIMAVGLRPCSGALIVLTFALLNGLVLGGILSVFAMALGTFITVAALATMAVMAKNLALKFAGSGVMSVKLQAIIEIGAALFIVLVGVLLFTAALTI
ncbi:delayed-early response protein/equilibrative nucleoside transporter [Phyllobacterium phragmitis]|uniref:Nickel/cobalt efflux system n=1 Tax=Phyllobacterium phragmitis TaxID=2670329 RepID=A0A2S9IQB7_9HYPH|nr:nickel/cobalt transporter [Phyllobacterium phragmitis]PRD42705.1 delayed-early response protein/equilibrative nucleoside transporter [Phyllobacterium phragmitis]